MAKQILFIQGAGEGAHGEDARLAASLRRELGPGYRLRNPAMPGEADPDLQAWSAAIAAQLSDMDPDADAVTVGHSAGAAIICLLLAAGDLPRPVAGVFLIAAPFLGDGGWRVEGASIPADLGRRLRDVPVFLYHGDADAIAPVAHLDLYARAIPQAAVRRLPGRDHQLDEDLGVVARDIESLLRSPPA